MLSEIARLDIQSLRQCGFQPTDEDIIRLNDLAVQIAHGREESCVNYPRVAKAGNVLLHEPTIGSIIWWFNFGKNAAHSDKERMSMHFFMLANSRNLKYLNSLTDDKTIHKELNKWLKNLQATEGELWRALLYVKRVYDDINELSYDDDNNKKDICDDEELIDKVWMNVIACSGMIGLNPEDLKIRTQSELFNLLLQANIHNKMPMKQSIANYYIKYRMILKEIENRGTKND